MPSRAALSAQTAKLDLRLTREAKRRLHAAVEASHRSVSDFVLQSALERADETLAERQFAHLNAKQWAAFQAVLDAPPKVIPELRRLLERKAPWE